MQREAQGHREKGKEQFYVVHKIVKTTALYALIGKPITDKKDDGTQDKEAGRLKYPRQVPVHVFDVQHGDTQQGHGEHTKEHTTVQQVHYPMELRFKWNVLGADHAPNGLSKVFRTALVPTELLRTGRTDHNG